MTIGDASYGDVVRIGSIHYRLMIQQRGGFLCRYKDEPEDPWSADHVWLLGIEPIDEIVAVNKVRAKGDKSANVDPMDTHRSTDSLNWKGTVK